MSWATKWLAGAGWALGLAWAMGLSGCGGTVSEDLAGKSSTEVEGFGSIESGLRRGRVAPLHVEGRHFVDTQGGVVLLRGINAPGNAKVPPFRGLEGGGSLRPLREWGMNVLRLLFTWEAYEPQPGHYDAQYLRYIEDVVDEAEREGLYVIVDFHQDAFSRFTNGGCGEGFPAWALPPDLTPLTPDNGPRCKLWGLRAAFAPHAKRAWEAFYAGEGLARERFLVMVERVARRMAQHPAVIGYDLLNEPWGDEVEQLAPLYEDEARVLRRADPSAILFVTPGALTVPGQRSKLPKPTFDNFAFAPHYYDIGISGVHVWTGRPAQQAFAHMAAVADVWNVPVFVGEFGAPANAWGGVRYLHGIWHQMDDRFYSGAQWVYTPQWDPVVKDGWNLEDFSVVDDRGQVRRNFSPRPYPARIAGEPLRFAIHEGGQGQGMDIELRWQHDPARGVTRVAFPEASAFAPERLHLKATSADVSCRWQGVGVACSSTVAGPKTVLFSSH